MTNTLEALQKLREPFPPHHISKLPKESRKQIDERKADRNKMVWKCEVCGGAHHKDAVHLDYVGHAAATDRLLDTDPAWVWEPLAVDQRGLPAFDENGGLWIKLTICGVTRLGYGSADGKTGGDAKKEIIGDAIRNAGMRFGMALDLWHKGDLHLEEDAEEKAKPAQVNALPFPIGPARNKTDLGKQVRAAWLEMDECGDADQFIPLLAQYDQLFKQLEEADDAGIMRGWWHGGGDNPGLKARIEQRKMELEV